MSNICTAKYLAFVARVGKSSGLNSFGLMWCNGLLFGPILLFWTFIKGDLELTMNFPYLFFPGFQTQEVRLRLNVDVAVPSKSSPAPPPIESFTDMDIAFHEYSTTTSIQAQAMPVALSGKDLLGCAETGSGKTAAFAIPMIQHCLDQPPVCRGDGPLALVLAPTRELAQQIEKERSELRAGVNIVVATPGRFIDHLQQGNTSLSRVSYVVLDEADRMLDMEFEPQIKEVMRNLPEKHQTLLFSATMPVEIESLAQEYLTDPVRVKVGKVSSPAANVAQFLVKVSDNEKNSNRIRKRKTKSFFTFGRVGSLSLARARAKSIVDCRCKCHLRQLVVDPAIEPGQAPVTRVPSFTFWPCMSGLIIKGDAGGMVFILAEGSQGFAECVRPKPRKSWPALHDIFRKSN